VVYILKERTGMKGNNRRSGIVFLGDIPWGTHICQLYSGKDDLLEILAPYFRAGLENNELCMWIASGTPEENEISGAMQKVMPDLDEYIKKGRFKIIPYDEWYLINNEFDAERVMALWDKVLGQALADGYEGIRAAGDTAWLQKKHWESFRKYEEAINGVIEKYRMIAFCAYPFKKCEASEVLDVIQNHEFTVIRQDNEWKVLGSRLFKKEERKLDEAEKKYRMVVDNSSDIIFSFDTSGKVDFISPNIYQLLGYKQEDVTGGDWLQLIHPDERESIRNNLSNVAENELRPRYIFRVLKKDGNIAFMEAISRFIAGSEGKTAYMVGVIRDITERRRIEAELEKTERLEMLGIFAGGIAHDFNNMLTPILGNIGLLKIRHSSRKEEKELLEEAENAGRRAKELTRHLLTFARGGEPVKKPAKTVKLIKDSVNFALHGSDLKPEFLIQKDLWQTEVDSGQINQAISNIILNARQAVKGGGLITIRADNAVVRQGENGLKEGRYVKIGIQDKGPGISEEHIGKIFNPFFTTKKGGIGLGLSIAYSIIKRHDGAVTVESETGRGTTFNIYIPASSNGTKTEETAKAFYEGKGNILLMDDEEQVRNTMGRVLMHFGYSVSFAREGREAIDLYSKALNSKDPFDAVIVDMIIPGGLGGKETAVELLKISPGARIVVTTGYSDDPVISDYKKYGFAAAIPKPCSVDVISSVMHGVVKGRRD